MQERPKSAESTLTQDLPHIASSAACAIGATTWPDQLLRFMGHYAEGLGEIYVEVICG
jgi:hypothetical protein